MPRKKQNSKQKKRQKEQNQSTNHEIQQNIEDLEQDIEINEDRDELNIDSLSDLDDLETIDQDYSEVEESDFFVTEDDLIICPGCGEIIEYERLKLLEECPSCGLNISEFEEVSNYGKPPKDDLEEEDW
ncbi:MAG: hypothetical protein ABDH21_03035 [bacterium]